MRSVVSRFAAAITASLLLGALAFVAPALAGSSQTYVVLYKATAVPIDAATKVERAEGTVIASYGAIGVVIASSSSTTFSSTLGRDSKVAAVASTARNGYRLADPDAEAGSQVVDYDPAPASDGEPLAVWQWDMAQIHAFEAHEINGGSRSVLVGDIDTGLDFTHPDLAPNYDAANSADCTSGAPAPLPVGNDANGHGTHTAGTIASAVNGIGITGVAPNVRIAGIKAGNDAGFFFPEAVICSFVWAGSHGVDITNNSYFADPWLFNCKNDKDQRAIYSAEQRAIKYAQSKGTLVIAALGNFSDDLAHPTQDVISPDDTTPIVRDITNACAVVPTEVPGVIGVTANGNLALKSYYSNYGVGVADVIAPGGDRRFQITADPGAGRILSTWPAAAACGISAVSAGAKYCWIQGTSMASPHAVGVAALIQSAHPGWSGSAVGAALTNTADPIPCPDTSLPIYANFPSVNNGAPQVCTGGAGYNSFNGNGQVNALSAVE